MAVEVSKTPATPSTEAVTQAPQEQTPESEGGTMGEGGTTPVEGGVGEKEAEAMAESPAGETGAQAAEMGATPSGGGQVLEGSAAESSGPGALPTSGYGGASRSLRILGVTLMALAALAISSWVGRSSRKRNA